VTQISSALRQLVIQRAGNCCEYCLQTQEDNPFSFHIEHIRAEKHRGITHPNNLCLSCPDCNRFKGSDIGSIDEETGTLTPLFNPRTQIWSDHFRLIGSEIEALTPEGRVTVFLLRLNNAERLAEREIMIELGTYPCRKV
jgi:HNH endonuclease